MLCGGNPGETERNISEQCDGSRRVRKRSLKRGTLKERGRNKRVYYETKYVQTCSSVCSAGKFNGGGKETGWCRLLRTVPERLVMCTDASRELSAQFKCRRTQARQRTAKRRDNARPYNRELFYKTFKIHTYIHAYKVTEGFFFFLSDQDFAKTGNLAGSPFARLRPDSWMTMMHRTLQK